MGFVILIYTSMLFDFKTIKKNRQTIEAVPSFKSVPVIVK